jgi:hypothetical protein
MGVVFEINAVLNELKEANNMAAVTPFIFPPVAGCCYALYGLFATHNKTVLRSTVLECSTDDLESFLLAACTLKK